MCPFAFRLDITGRRAEIGFFVESWPVITNVNQSVSRNPCVVERDGTTVLNETIATASHGLDTQSCAASHFSQRPLCVQVEVGLVE